MRYSEKYFLFDYILPIRKDSVLVEVRPFQRLNYLPSKWNATFKKVLKRIIFLIIKL